MGRICFESNNSLAYYMIYVTTFIYRLSTVIGYLKRQRKYFQN